MRPPTETKTLQPGTLVQPNVDFWLNFPWDCWTIKCHNPKLNWKNLDGKILLLAIMDEASNGLVLNDNLYVSNVIGGQTGVRVINLLFGIREVELTIEKSRFGSVFNAFKLSK